MKNAVALACLLLGLVFSGCVSGETTRPADNGIPDQADPAEFDQNTGAIAGLVTDEQIQPLAGAMVGLIEAPEKTAITDTAGRFSISHVEPGTYRVVAQVLGYESVGRTVTVEPGGVIELQITLTALPSLDPWKETFIWNGFIGCSVAYIRSVLQLSNGNSCPGSSQPNNFFHEPYKKGWPTTMEGLLVEATWRTRDFLGFDINQREGTSEMYARVRQQSPVHLFLERCGDYTKTHFGRQPMPCTDDQLDASKMHIETWYVGQYQQEAHTLDPVCQTSTPYWPAYQQGCYGLGVAFDLKWTNYITVFHRELPENAANHSELPDG